MVAFLATESVCAEAGEIAYKLHASKIKSSRLMVAGLGIKIKVCPVSKICNFLKNKQIKLILNIN